MSTLQKLLPRDSKPVGLHSLGGHVYFCGFITAANAARSGLHLEKKVGRRLLPLGMNSSHSRAIQENPYCCQKRLYDRYIWLRPLGFFTTQKVNYFSQIAQKAAYYRGFILQLRSNKEVFVIEEKDGPSKVEADSFCGNRSGCARDTPAHRRSVLRQAATLRPVIDPVVDSYRKPIILLHRGVKDDEITTLI